jgi:RNA polymerase sigma-70 factor (ECF subfamily)
MEAHRNAGEAAHGVPELFVRHTEALRALAQALLRDRAQADDVVQDTWLAWLESPPRDLDQPTPWLKRVLRNRVINSRRARARREAHERAAARPERVDESPSRERDEALRAVVNAVLALDEPAKEVVWQRYFENRSVEEIAGRLRLSVRAVYDRLTQAHEKLRRELAGEFGSDERRARALLLLAGRGGEGAAAIGTAALFGAWLSTPGVLLAASAALVALVAWLAWRPAPGELALSDARASLPAAQSEQVELLAGDIEGARDEAAVERTAVKPLRLPDEPAPRWESPAHEYEVEISVVDENDLPVSSSAVYAAPAGHTLNRIGETDEAGVLVARFRAFTSSLELDVASSPKGMRRRVALASGRSALAILGGPFGFTFEVSGSKFRTGRFSGMLSSRISSTGELTLSSKWDGEVSAIVDAVGWITFVEPWLAVFDDSVEPIKSIEPRLASGFVTSSFGETSKSLELVGVGEPHRKVSGNPVDPRAAVDAPPAELTGRVLDANGDPVPRSNVFVRRVGGAIWRGVQADDAGEYTASELKPGEYELRARGGELGRASASFALAAGQRHAWTPRLDAGLVFAGRLLDREGVPLANWIVRIDADPSRAHLDFAVTDADGRFAIANVPEGFLRVLARPEWAAGKPAVLVHERVTASSRELELRAPILASDRGATLRLDATLRDLRGVREAELRVLRADSGQVAHAAITGMELDEHGTPGGRMTWFFAAEQLLPGDYSLELHVPARLPRRIGALRVDTGGLHELHERIVEPSAHLVVDARPNDAGGPNRVRLVLRGEHFELVSSAFDIAHGARIDLVPGEHELVSDQGLRRLAGFELAPGATAHLKPDGALEPAQPQR